MKVGIGQFSYHRYFGEITYAEHDPGVRWGLNDFIQRAVSHRVGIVGVQTCFLSEEDAELLPEIATKQGLEVILEWGHPDGLKMGRSPESVQDLRSWMLRAGRWSLPTLRIVAGYPTLRGVEPVDVQIRRLVPLLRELSLEAMEWGITLAIENHADLTPVELERLIHATGSSNLRAVLDLGNRTRLGQDLITSVRRLAPLAEVVHLRNLVVLQESFGNPLASWPTAPLGCGSLDIAAALNELYSTGFRGPLLLELSPLHERWAGEEDEVIRQSLVWLRKWDESKDNASLA
jgi:sugar phosphate isomerase/epimerase